MIRVTHLLITPKFALLDEEGRVVEEVEGSSFLMFPGKFIPFTELIEKLEREVQANQEDLEKLRSRPLL